MKLFNNPVIVLILILIALALTLLISMLVFFFFFKRRTNLGIKWKIYSVLIGLAVTATISSLVILIGVKNIDGLKPYDRAEQKQCVVNLTDDRSIYITYSHSKNYDIGHLEVIDIENQKLIYELEVRAKVVNYSDFTETGEGNWESSWCYLSLDNDGKILIRQK